MKKLNINFILLFILFFPIIKLVFNVFENKLIFIPFLSLMLLILVQSKIKIELLMLILLTCVVYLFMLLNIYNIKTHMIYLSTMIILYIPLLNILSSSRYMNLYKHSKRFFLFSIVLIVSSLLLTYLLNQFTIWPYNLTIHDSWLLFSFLIISTLNKNKLFNLMVFIFIFMIYHFHGSRIHQTVLLLMLCIYYFDKLFYLKLLKHFTKWIYMYLYLIFTFIIIYIINTYEYEYLYSSYVEMLGLTKSFDDWLRVVRLYEGILTIYNNYFFGVGLGVENYKLAIDSYQGNSPNFLPLTLSSYGGLIFYLIASFLLTLVNIRFVNLVEFRYSNINKKLIYAFLISLALIIQFHDYFFNPLYILIYYLLYFSLYRSENENTFYS